MPDDKKKKKPAEKRHTKAGGASKPKSTDKATPSATPRDRT